MGNQGKTRLTIVFAVVLAIILFFWLRNHPKYAAAIQAAAAAIPQISGITVPSEGLNPININFPSIAPWEAPPINNYITNVPATIAHLATDGNNSSYSMSAGMPGLPDMQDKGSCSLCTTSTDTTNPTKPVGNVAQPATLTAPYPVNYPLLGAPPSLGYYAGGVGRRPVW